MNYTPPGGSIQIALEPRPGEVAVSVSDTGRGIPRDELPRVFDRFHRGEPGDSDRAGSAGLGLAIVRRILDLHGSRITLSSELHKGTRFEFALAAQQAA